MPTLFGLARSGGYQIVQMAGLVREFGFSESDLAVMQQNAIEASFAPAEWKRKLRKELSFNKSSKVTDGKN